MYKTIKTKLELNNNQSEGSPRTVFKRQRRIFSDKNSVSVLKFFNSVLFYL